MPYKGSTELIYKNTDGTCKELQHTFTMPYQYQEERSFCGIKVKVGDLVGFVDHTGWSETPHLHYEVIKNRKKINPVNYYFNDLSAEQYEEMIEISLRSGQTFD